MKNPEEILRDKREAKGFTQTQLGSMIGLGLRSYQKLESGEFPKFKTGIINKLDEILDSNLYELIYEHNDEEINSSNISKKTPYLKERQRKKLNTEENTIMFYDANARAGTQAEAEILPVKKSEGVLHISDLFKGSQYAIRISGNSMTPSYPAGAIIGIREIQDKQITPGSVYVIEKGSDLWIKRLYYSNDDQTTGMFECISDNTMKFETGPIAGKYCYPPFDIKIDDIRKLFKVTGIYKPNELTVIN